ncbi:hypothetical protein BN3590_04448 [Clostridium sp. C105KSO15]|nr:hypothetical protein BN3590_04448 [Clostridium sp. C105KSO15]
MFKDWNFWFSIITAGVAIVAIYQTQHQIKLSNKQHLFDKRVENYLIAKGLVQLYRSNSSHFIHEEDRPIFEIDSEFTWLTNNVYLENITLAIENPLTEPYHKEFLTKLEEVKEVSSKIKFLFLGETAELLGDFVLHYQRLLFAMYQYQILVNKLKETTNKFNLSLEESQEKVHEKTHRNTLKQAFDNLKQADSLLKDKKVERQIEKQIRL